MRLIHLIAVVATVIPFATAQKKDAAVDVVATAKALRKATYANYVYGSKGARKINCVQFVDAVVKDLARQCGKKITAAHTRTLAIQLSKADHAKLQSLVANGDRKIRGVQTMLVDAGLGKAIDPGKAKPGDFVQYWYRSGKRWYGHAGIVSAIDKNGVATIYGSHKTTLQSERKLDKAKRKGGVGPGPRFNLANKKRKVYVARWTVPQA